MNILSHRGYWKSAGEKNTPMAFLRSFGLGFGTETDVRDAVGELVISHDMPNGSELTLKEYFQLPGITNLPLALNIKADGLATQVMALAKAHEIRNWFVFDMSIPDMRSYLKLGCPVYCRLSEVEQDPPWMADCAGVWLDSFSDTWYGPKEIEKILNQGKDVCIVSSELHGRNWDDQWQMLKAFSDHPGVSLCTDHPETAQAYFFNHQTQ